MLLKYNLVKNLSFLSYKFLKLMPTGGKSYPGYLFIKYAGLESLGMLADNQIEKASLLVTGTNGKTTTTTMIIDLLSEDTTISKSVDNNTVYALTTALLTKKAEIGVFEYGIRDIKHGMPDLIEKYIKPKMVVYTNVSREHTQVSGVKNSFEDYIKAKTLLSKNMMDGIVVTNADDPVTCKIGQDKQKDGHTIYYGVEADNISDNYEGNVKCPVCGNTLEYTHNYMNQRGKYSCSCGFRRSEPSVKLTKYQFKDNKNCVTIEGTSYNYFTKKDVVFKVDLTLPVFGLHNVYNVLAASTAYSCFTLDVENLEKNLENYFNNMDLSILPPGRFEILNVDDKTIGIGQGDNGDALKVNYEYMKYFIQDNDYEFIYCTPDVNEEEIFEDHLNVLKHAGASHVTVVPGRVSVDIANEYYNKIKENNINATFCPVDYDFDKRADSIMDLAKKSEYKYIIISGCGEEHTVWNVILNKLKKEGLN